MVLKVSDAKKKFFTTTVLFLLLVVTLSCFNVVLSSLNYNASAFSNTKKETLDIPSDLNFVDDDKKAFLNYCKDIYGNEKPFSIDTMAYCYYGTIEGRRLYRFNATYIPYENVYNESTIGGYVFSSSCLYRPYSLGLYIVDGKNVYTLAEAYEKGLVNIAKVHELYMSKHNS